MWYILSRSILFCWVAWCNMMCKVWTDDAGCDDLLWAASSCVINPSWGIDPILALVALEKSQSHMSAGCTDVLTPNTCEAPTFYMISYDLRPCVINLPSLRGTDVSNSGTGCTWELLYAFSWYCVHRTNIISLTSWRIWEKWFRYVSAFGDDQMCSAFSLLKDRPGSGTGSIWDCLVLGWIYPP